MVHTAFTWPGGWQPRRNVVGGEVGGVVGGSRPAILAFTKMGITRSLLGHFDSDVL
jgi:hypothetical protein